MGPVGQVGQVGRVRQVGEGLIDRRVFVALGTLGILGLGSSRTDARPQDPQPQPEPPTQFKYGESRLGISDDFRDGTLYVPKNYNPGTPMPVLMWLHGLAGSGEGASRSDCAARQD